MNYWDKRYKKGGNSGYGSYGAQLIKKLQWLDNLSIKSIYDYGCGDFNFGKHLLELYPYASYTGYDSSKVIIKQNSMNYPQYTFTSSKPLPEGDLVLCIDVLLHILDDKEYEQTLKDLEGYTNYLAITGYEYDSDLNTHVRHRKFDYKRFGEPLIREVIEEDGQMYFYLFKKAQGDHLIRYDNPQASIGPSYWSFDNTIVPQIDISKTTCVLITKDKTYPPEILAEINRYPFGQVLVGLNCDSPYKKYDLIEKARFDMIYYQDDDAIVPIDKLLEKSKPGIINVGMKAGHFDAYNDTRMTMGLGWGCFFDKNILKSLKIYTNIYGFDKIYKRETERILTYLNYPQNRVILDIIDLPSATAPDRLYHQVEHKEYAQLVEERCSKLVK